MYRRSQGCTERARSRGLVDQEGDLARLKREVDEAVPLVDRVAAERLAQEHVPVRLPFLVHVLLDFPRNLTKNVRAAAAYLNAVGFEVVLVEGLLGDRDRVLEHVVRHVCWPLDLGLKG